MMSEGPVEGRSQPLDIAVIGSGIAGLAAAWLLGARHRVTVYEAAARPGGHSNTVDVPGTDGPIAVDTGFIVYNPPNYPNLTALFDLLAVPTQPSDMSFGVSLDNGALEYAGTDLAGLFAQPANLLRPRFWRMLRDLRRFYAEGSAFADADPESLLALGAWLDSRGFGAAFQQDHLLPMAAAIWSTPAGLTRQQPAAAFLRFCGNHGLLQLTDRPPWRTVVGGSREYVARMTRRFADRIRLNTPVVELRRGPAGVELRTAAGDVARHDHAVVATHADQALRLLADPSAAERALLGGIRSTRNLAVLHRDRKLMPRRRRAWCSWNYLGRRDTAGEARAPTVTYWMNRLQRLADPAPLFVTLNPTEMPDPALTLRTESYEHPLLDAAAGQAQRALWSLQGEQRTWFCGAWFGAGFHEDGLQAGLAVAEALGGVRRPWRVAAESGRIHLAPAAVVMA